MRHGLGAREGFFPGRGHAVQNLAELRPVIDEHEGGEEKNARSTPFLSHTTKGGTVDVPPPFLACHAKKVKQHRPLIAACV